MMASHDVFISYSAQEYSDAEMVRSVLEKNGISCWMAPHSIPGGSNYAKEIPSAIRNCKAFVLMLSRKAQSSIWVPKELDLAVNEKKIILPFMLEDCELLDEFNFYLIGAQRYAAYERKAEVLQSLVRRIRAILDADGGSAGAAPQPKPQPKPQPQPRPQQPSVRPVPVAEAVQRFLLSDPDVRRIRATVFADKNNDRVRQRFPIPSRSRILLAHDDTLRGSGKNGFALCDDGIYLKGLFAAGCTFTSWRDFTSCSDVRPLPNDHYTLAAYAGSREYPIAYVSTTKSRDDVQGILQRLLDELKRTPGLTI